jgi:hypothetical protein
VWGFFSGGGDLLHTFFCYNHFVVLLQWYNIIATMSLMSISGEVGFATLALVFSHDVFEAVIFSYKSIYLLL